jgi:perosamine synthetase
MLTTGREDLDALVRSLRDHGATRTDLERHEASGSFLLASYPHLGYNYRMTDIQAAIGRSQMDRADWIMERRRAIAKEYDEAFSDSPWLQTPFVPEGHVHGYQAYVCMFVPEEPTLENVDRLHADRNALMGRLEADGIATRQGTHAAGLQTYYQTKYGLRPDDFPNAHLADRLTMALPLYPQMTAEERTTVIEAVERHVRGAMD